MRQGDDAIWGGVNVKLCYEGVVFSYEVMGRERKWRYDLNTIIHFVTSQPRELHRQKQHYNPKQHYKNVTS